MDLFVDGGVKESCGRRIIGAVEPNIHAIDVNDGGVESSQNDVSMIMGMHQKR
jgi:hypothetical protein